MILACQRDDEYGVPLPCGVCDHCMAAARIAELEALLRAFTEADDMVDAPALARAFQAARDYLCPDPGALAVHRCPVPLSATLSTWSCPTCGQHWNIHHGHTPR